MNFNAYLGLDVPKQTIAIAIADDGRRGDVRFYGQISNTPDAVAAMLKKLGNRHGRLHCVYESGPCGYGLYRQINDAGHVCHRQARQRIQGFLLRYGRRYAGAVWKKQHRVWLGNQSFEHPAQQIAFQTYINAMDQAHDRKGAIERQILAFLPEWSLGPVVEALQALRGVALIVAAGVVAEVGDMRRFDNPRQLMAYLGLVPGEHSSGETRRLTSITKAGSVVARRLIVEAAWAYRLPAKIGQAMYRRQETLPPEVRDIAWKAQVRLCARYRRMLVRRKKAPVVITAIARELVGFIWAIAQVTAPRAAS